jgi:hypothetical protein
MRQQLNGESHTQTIGETPALPLTAYEQAIHKFLEDSDFTEAKKHLLDMMEYLTADFDYSAFGADLKQQLWWRQITLYNFLESLEKLQTEKEVVNA